MPWNYRVLHTIEDGDEWYAIHEVYYDNEGHPVSVTAEPEPALGDTLEDLEEDLRWQLKALSEPVLEMSDFPDGKEGE